jgi:23S rRNA (cytidine1920-2'-O)/16S rRNA (cytidine1409-2'-O)-methyltransferase
MPRLDQLLVNRALFSSREKARRAIMAGSVLVDGRRIDKPGTTVNEAARVEILGPREPYVSRGGRKLEAALGHFRIDPRGMVCMDVGASTGGFTDCLLQHGAERVYAVDVGHGQLDYRLRLDPRVVVLEGVNVRYLDPQLIPEPCDLVTLDLSFISLVKVVPAVLPAVASRGRLLALVKPQFEAGRGQVGKGGVVRDEQQRRRIVEERVAELASLGLAVIGIVDSEVAGARGNRETFALFRRRDRESTCNA